jgi:hypothetical protein
MNPDHDIEAFWLSFKQSMIHFYNEHKIPPHPIVEWSSILNNFQSQKLYLEIEDHIRKYLTLYSIDVMKFNGSRENSNLTYHPHILMSNIKRWNELSKFYNFVNDDKKYYNKVFLLLDIYKTMIKHHNKDIIPIFNQPELFLSNEDFSILIKYSIENNLPSILSKLNTYYDVFTMINNLYSTDFNNISFKKIVKKIIIRI